MLQPKTDDSYLPARQVWERYGVTDMTIHRWIRDTKMGFPKPYYFGRFRYWLVSELVAWERAVGDRRKEAA